MHGQASDWEQSSSLPLCRLLHAYQAVAHSWHSRIERHSLVPVGAARVGEEGREHPRNQTAVLAPSLTHLARSLGVQQRRKRSPPSLSLCKHLLWRSAGTREAEAGAVSPHLTSTPPASMIQLLAGEGAKPSTGSQGFGQKDSRKWPDAAPHLTGEKVEDQVC